MIILYSAFWNINRFRLLEVMHTKQLILLMFFSAIATSLAYSQKSGSGAVLLPADLKVMDLQGSEHILLNLAKDKKQLFYKINPIYCGPCIDREIRCLNGLVKQLPDHSIVVLTSFSDFRSFLSFSLTNTSNLLCYNIVSTDLSFNDSAKEGSCYFNIAEVGEVIDIFFSDKQSPQSSKKYLIKTCKKLFGVSAIL